MEDPILKKAISLFERSGKIRIISDEKFNVKWNSREYDENQVVFSDISGKTPTNGMICPVYIKGHCCNAECTVVNIDGTKIYTWTVKDNADLVFHIGYKNTFKQLSYLIECGKQNINELNEFSSELPSGAREKHHMICSDTLRMFEVLDKMAMIFFNESTEERVIPIYGEVSDVTCACNRFIGKYRRSIQLFSAQADTLRNMSIVGDKQIFATALFCIFKRAITSSYEQNYLVTMSHDSNRVYLYFKYLILDDPKRSLTEAEFDYFAATLYIKYIGGSMNMFHNEKSEEVELSFPICHKENVFKSSSTSNDAEELYRLAEIFLESAVKPDEQ